MRRRLGASLLILASLALSWPAMPALAQAQTGPSGAALVAPPSPSPGRNVTATGKTMPPAGGRAPGAETSKATQSADAAKSSMAADMLKAQKAAEARNKAWDSKMRKTMGSICSGC